MSLLAWVNSVQDAQVIDLDELSDGIVLGRVCLEADPSFFSVCRTFTKSAPDKAQIRSLCLLLERYFLQVIHANLSDSIASSIEYDMETLASVVLAMTVQSEANSAFVGKIQSLPEEQQEELMKIIEGITSSLKRDIKASDLDALSASELQTQLRNTLNERDVLQLRLQLRPRARDPDASSGSLEDEDSDEARQEHFARKEAAFKQEVDRLKTELNASQDELAIAEEAARLQTTRIASLEATAKEAETAAEEIQRLKDQVDELKYASEKLTRAENALEKYKRKLEDAADVRRSMKSLEEENAALIDRNAKLDEDLSKLSTSKGLVDSYKAQLTESERKLSASQQEAEALRFQLEQTSAKLQIAEEERARDEEAVELYEERFRELESTGQTTSKKLHNGSPTANASSSDSEDDRPGPHVSFADSISGTTMTELRLRIKQLERELKTSRESIAVLENLVKDANASRSKYETDFLNERREVLKLKNVLEEIRSGKAEADTPEVVLALRHQLNETSEELDGAKLKLTTLDVESKRLQKELTIAQSNLELVDKDQLEIIASLRRSISVEKDSLQAEVDALKKTIEQYEERAKLHTSQVNKLLIDKIDLQTDSIAQRERMLQSQELTSSLRNDLADPSKAELNQQRLTELEDALKARSEEVASLESKLEELRAFTKDQHDLAKTKYTTLANTASQARIDELQQKLRQAETDLEKALSSRSDADLKNRKEQQLMVQAWQKIGFDRLTTRETGGSWLAQQRFRSD